jgi:hypothetical protein
VLFVILLTGWCSGFRSALAPIILGALSASHIIMPLRGRFALIGFELLSEQFRLSHELKARRHESRSGKPNVGRRAAPQKEDRRIGQNFDVRTKKRHGLLLLTSRTQVAVRALKPQAANRIALGSPDHEQRI